MNKNLETIKKINNFINKNRKKESPNFNISSIIKKFFELIEAKNYWFALVDKKNSIEIFYQENIFENILSDKIFEDYKSLIYDYIQTNLFLDKLTFLNRDPIIKISKLYNIKDFENISTITIKLINHNKIIGFLSFHLNQIDDKNIFENKVVLIEIFANILCTYISEMEYIKQTKKLKERIRKSYNLFNITLETTENATILIEKNSIISFANSQFEKLSGYKKEEIEGKKSLFEFVSEANLNQMREYHKLRRESNNLAPNKYKFNFINRFGDKKNISITIDMIPETEVSIASFLDETDIKRLESRIIKISEEERQHIGNDLHDNLGPHFVGVQFMLKLLREKINKKNLPNIEEVDEIYNLIAEGINHIRKITKGLKPVDIQPESLGLALKELAFKTEKRFKISCNFKYDDTISIDNNITTTHIYYIIQEAINNSIKHASPKNIKISMLKEKNKIIISIEDDGTGISEKHKDSDGMGINIMEYRANIINGSLKILKNKNSGTTVQCSIDEAGI